MKAFRLGEYNMTEDEIDEKVSKAKEEIKDFFRKEFTPILENVFNTEYTGHFKLDEEPPCPEIREMSSEISALIQSHIKSMKELNASLTQILSYIILGQSQFAALKALIEMVGAVDGLKQKATESDEKQTEQEIDE